MKRSLLGVSGENVNHSLAPARIIYNQMKRLVFYLICAVVWVCAYATEMTQHRGHVTGAPESTVKSDVISDLRIPHYGIETGKAATTRGGAVVDKEDEDDPSWINVTFTFPALGEEWIFAGGHISVFNEAGFEKQFVIEQYDDFGNFSATGLTSVTKRLPEGTYEFIAEFVRLNSEYLDGVEDYPRIYIVENINVKEDCVIELKPQDSNICLNMKPRFPDGEELRFRKVKLYGEDDFDIVEEGNVMSDHMDMLISYKGNLVLEREIQPWSVEYVEGTCVKYDPYDFLNFYVNPVSDNYLFRRVHTIMPLEQQKGLYLAATECLGGKEGFYTNGEYVHEDTPILPQPSIADRVDDRPYGIFVRPYMDPNFKLRGVWYQSEEMQLWDVWSSGPEKPVDKNSLYYSYYKILGDLTVENPDWGEITPYYTYSPYFFPLAKDGISLASFPNGDFACDETGYDYNQTYPGNATFASELDKVVVPIGGSAPLLQCWVNEYFNWGISSPTKIIKGLYVGRVGEKIDSDHELVNCILSVDGEEVASGDFNDVVNWMQFNWDYMGSYELNLTVDNCEIDGLKGGNRAKVRFDNYNEDDFPPTITMLQMRNKENEVTQRFSTPADGEIAITATDYFIEYNTDEYTKWGYHPYWLEYFEAAKVVATCKPYGSESEACDEIRLTVEPDLFMKGLGSMYKGSLSDVTLTSPTGWFDLTLTVEDAAGNSQTQTISPAFKIDSLCGAVQGVRDDRIKVVGNSIIALPGSRIYNLAGQQVPGENLPNGLYLVVTPESSVKVII